MAAGEVTEIVALAAGTARVEVLPGMGGALARVEVDGRPVLRPWSGDAGRGPFDVSSIVLAPFSNRISRPFSWGGETVTLERNLPAEAFPIHGDAFQKRWSLAERTGDRVVLVLADGACGSLRYQAQLTYAVSAVGLTAGLALTNRSGRAMPFGLGFHPWFPRDAGTRLEFQAESVWQEDARHLPASDRPAVIPGHWDFAGARPLPADWINNAFDGWGGRARIIQGDAGVSVVLRASASLGLLVVFSPGAQADFFCVEPVSHPVDAHNLPGMPGLAILKEGETLSATMELDWA